MPRAAPRVVLAFVLSILAVQGQQSSVCTNACRYASDSECDDGGPGSEYDMCVCGTDCGDCGTRPSCIASPPPPSPSPPPPCYAYGTNRCNASPSTSPPCSPSWSKRCREQRAAERRHSRGDGANIFGSPVFIAPVLCAVMCIFSVYLTVKHVPLLAVWFFVCVPSHDLVHLATLLIVGLHIGVAMHYLFLQQ